MRADGFRGHDLPVEPELPFEEPVSEFHLADYLDVLRRRWRLIAVFCIVALAGGLVHYFITPKRYQASTTIQINRRSTAIGGLETHWLEQLWNMEFYPTQYKLLESRGLAERVVMSLRLYEDPSFNPGWARLAGDVPESAPPPELDEERLGRLGQRLLGGLSVSPIKGTQLAQISFRSESPELAARIANGVADAFIDWGIESRSETVDKATSFLGKQIEALKQEIQDKEQTLQALGRRSDIVGLDAEASSPTMQRLEALNRDYIGALSERIDKEVLYNESLSTPQENLADSLSGGLVSQLRKELLNLEQEYASKLKVYKADWPAMVELQSEIDDKRAHLAAVVEEMVQQARRGARAAYQTAVRREQALSEELERAKEDTINLGSATVQYNNLKLEISTRRQLLDELLRRQSEAEVATRLQDTRETNVRVVDRALVPRSPYLPSMQKDLGMALALGLFLGVGCVFLLEYLDRTIKTAEEAERFLGLPVLAVIPDVEERGRGYGYGYGYGHWYGRSVKRHKKARRLPFGKRRDAKPEEAATAIELLPSTKPRHAVSEAYRSLRTAVLLSSTEELEIVALTSAQSGEGKTATAANLAVVMAQLGRSVLLVDADLRKPRLHRVFGLANRQGLVHALTAGGTLDEIAQETDVQGLHVVTSGTVPPNPSELLASERMQEFLRQAAGRYDMVVVDTPPLLAVTDGSLVGAMADGVIFCLQAGRVLREEATGSCERLRMAGIRVIGSVLNRYTPTSGSDPKHYYYSYEAYGAEESADSAA